MAEFKTAAEVADEYLLYLKGYKPDVNIDQVDSDWWVRSRVIGGMLSGIYADQKLISNDAFPQSARREALEKHLFTYFGEGFKPATPAVGSIIVFGTDGSTMPVATQWQYSPNGNTYQTTEEFTLSGASGTVPVQSVDVGQTQNLLAGAELVATTPIPGFTSTATVGPDPLSDARNEETNEQAAERILEFIRQPIAGGKESDYKQWAVLADPSVIAANVFRFAFGFGTVGVIISAGTQDIDFAIDNDIPIVVTPSQELVETVQAYIEERNPITDCATVSGAIPLSVDVTVHVRYKSGDNNTILVGQTMTQAELVQREVRRAIYKTPPGGRIFGTSGYLVASEIEEVIDIGLSASPYQVGKIEMLVDRQVQNLAASGANRMILGSEVCVPGTITVVEV